jgi:DNA-3-methyladenine glycosylase II
MTPDELAKARRHLLKGCPTIAKIVKRVGACEISFNPDSFAVLCRAIIGQQLSTKAAASIHARVVAMLGGHYRPNSFQMLTDEQLRGCGLSNGKVRFLRDLVRKVNDGTVPIRKLPKLENDEIRERLLEVNGIGPWTVDMYLMFGLGRPDVLPTGDLGIRMGFKKAFGLDELPTRPVMFELATPWQPYRTVASWYLWRLLELKVPC